MKTTNSWSRALTSALALYALLGFGTAAVAAEAASAEAEAVEPASVDDLKVTQAASLDELLRNVEQRRVVESREHSQREAQFARDKAAQAKMLADAKAEQGREERRSEALETRFQENETAIGDLQEALDKRLGSLRELFGVLQQVAGDTRGLFEGSIISAQYPGRGEWLSALAKKMGTSTELASIEEMETLWFELQREMTETGRIAKFNGTVILNNGDKVDQEIIRVGAFNLVADGKYIQFDANDSSMVELPRQPSGRFTSTTEALSEASVGDIVAFGIDPTRGSLLSLLIQAATLGDQIGSLMGGISKGECYLPWCDGQGGSVGSVILLAGLVGVLIGIERLVSLSLIAGKVNSQRKSTTIDEGNPLGRVLQAYDENKDVDLETLELKLGEAILRETPGLTRNITLMQVISVVAPLMGLLGTVIGMIMTFQAITLFGTGDPKTMANGISTALVTTVEGLVVAIPMTLFHAVVAARSRGLIHILEEQSAGIIAEQAERAGKALG
ncbi:MAG: MotA/TolQ/ExbB proton channel family protein [Pseudomonadales bacterium]